MLYRDLVKINRRVFPALPREGRARIRTQPALCSCFLMRGEAFFHSQESWLGVICCFGIRPAQGHRQRMALEPSPGSTGVPGVELLVQGISLSYKPPSFSHPGLFALGRSPGGGKQTLSGATGLSLPQAQPVLRPQLSLCPRLEVRVSSGSLRPASLSCVLL